MKIELHGVEKDYECDKLSSFFSILSNSTRLKILCSLRGGEKNISELVKIIGASKNNISIQLRHLRLTNMIEQRKENRFVYCKIKNKKLIRLIEQIGKNVQELNLNEVSTK